MLTCEMAETLVARDADGLLTTAERATLDAHVAHCEACRELRGANFAVKQALALRVDAPVPVGFAARVSARIEPSAGWLDAVDWRRWTEWMLPVAAALLLMVVGIAGAGGGSAAVTGQASTSERVSAALESWPLSGDAETSPAASALAPDVTSDELLADMLGSRVAGAEGKANGR
jgi:anti-sigma factor RsiW